MKKYVAFKIIVKGEPFTLPYPPHLLISFLLLSCVSEIEDYGINTPID